MAFWLFKEEPSCYSYSDLEKDGSTNWSGITNALAQKHLRSCQPGDLVFYYHTGDEKAIVGIMEVAGVAVQDTSSENEKHVMVPVKPLRRLAKPVTLATIKADKLFNDWELVRIGRLSVMPCSEERWKRIEALASGTAEPITKTTPKKKPKGKAKK